MGVCFRYFFQLHSKTLVIYAEFRYISRIFPTLFSKLISIFIFLFDTFSMGGKTHARLTQERTVRLHCIMRNGASAARAGVLEPSRKIVVGKF